MTTHILHPNMHLSSSYDIYPVATLLRSLGSNRDLYGNWSYDDVIEEVFEAYEQNVDFRPYHDKTVVISINQECTVLTINVDNVEIKRVIIPHTDKLTGEYQIQNWAKTSGIAPVKIHGVDELSVIDIIKRIYHLNKRSVLVDPDYHWIPWIPTLMQYCDRPLPQFSNRLSIGYYDQGYLDELEEYVSKTVLSFPIDKNWVRFSMNFGGPCKVNKIEAWLKGCTNPVVQNIYKYVLENGKVGLDDVCNKFTGNTYQTDHPVRILQYNVLSSNLCSPSYHIACAADNLKPEVRLKRLLSKLREECDKGAVICLQEVAPEWIGPLTEFFIGYDYVMIQSQYGSNSFTMGCAIAFNKNNYSIDNTKVVRVGASIPSKVKPPYCPIKQRFSKIWSSVTELFLTLMYWCLGKTYTPTYPARDPWDYASQRENTMILTEMMDLDSQTTFALAVYHMPCAYRDLEVMTLHMVEAVSIAQKYAGIKNSNKKAEKKGKKMITIEPYSDANSKPLIFAGDFNIKPSSEHYQALVHGQKLTAVPENKGLKFEWNRTIARMNSAYRFVHRAEPEKTLMTHTAGQTEIFQDTLDYIFYAGSNIHCLNAEVPEFNNCIPDEVHPSDHVPLTATFVM